MLNILCVHPKLLHRYRRACAARPGLNSDARTLGSWIPLPSIAEHTVRSRIVVPLHECRSTRPNMRLDVKVSFRSVYLLSRNMNTKFHAQRQLLARSERVKGIDFHPTEPWVSSSSLRNDREKKLIDRRFSQHYTAVCYSLYLERIAQCLLAPPLRPCPYLVIRNSGTPSLAA